MKLHHWFFPPLCYQCRQKSDNGQLLCDYCWQSLPYLNPDHLCQRCGLILTTVGTACGHCLQKSFAFDRCVPMLRYTSECAPLITRLKFNGQLLLADLLGYLLAEYLSQVYQNCPLPQVIIPIPLHRKRLWKRGFNQSVELSRPLSALLNIPLDIDLLSKSRNIVAQSSLDAQKRMANVRNVFNVATHTFTHVALLDDVVTTGATVNEAAKALKVSGVKQVDVWCIARTH